MSVILYQPSAFDKHRSKGEIIGRIVIEYGELEFDLCRLTGALINDTNTAVKAVYRMRGETQRINVSDALIRGKLPIGRTRTIYGETVARLRQCLTIRNQYAHTNWALNVEDQLTFVDIEEAAKTNASCTDIGVEHIYIVSDHLLADQTRLFHQVGQNLKYLAWELGESPERPSFGEYHYICPIVPSARAQSVAAWMDNSAGSATPPTDPGSFGPDHLEPESEM